MLWASRPRQRRRKMVNTGLSLERKSGSRTDSMWKRYTAIVVLLNERNLLDLLTTSPLDVKLTMASLSSLLSAVKASRPRRSRRAIPQRLEQLISRLTMLKCPLGTPSGPREEESSLCSGKGHRQSNAHTSPYAF